MTEGPIPDCLSRTVGALGGFLSSTDFRDARAEVMPARSFPFAGAIVHGAEEECSGFGVCRQACGELGSLPANWADRDTTRIGEIAAALGKAWTSRDGATRGLVAPAGTAQHTTHLCTADDAGGMVSLTFTHGPLWFGAGVLDPETGILLNCGANLLVASRASPDRVFAQANICPIIVADPDGTCAFGSPGGRRIPGLTATFLVDLLLRRFDAGPAIANPRISVANDGALEVERPLDAVMPSARVIERDQFYGPASAIVRKPDGTLLGARDPRFEGALARIGG
jgi:gamma-glutamyltranspeptidase